MSPSHVKSEPYVTGMARTNETKKILITSTYEKKLQNSVAKSSFQGEHVGNTDAWDDMGMIKHYKS